MKSPQPMVDLAPYAALFLDVAAWAPDLRPSLCKDYERLCKVVETRGGSFIMIDLPEAGKVFDYSLSRGFLNPANLPHTFGKGINSADRDYFLKHLLLKVFTEDGTIRPSPPENAVFFIRQILYLMKKVDLPCSDAAVESAYLEFKKIESSTRRPSLNWELDELDAHRRKKLSFLDGYVEKDLVSEKETCPKPLIRALDYVARKVVRLFPDLNPYSISPRHGPGAVVDVKSGMSKYSFPNWPRKLGRYFPPELFAQHREDLHLDTGYFPGPHEPAARLCAVPKTLKAPRIITVEPTSNQYIQQGILRWIRENLPEPLQTSIDFTDQIPSRDLALAGSLDGSLSTVDLSSASDRLSLWVIERIFSGLKSPGLLHALHSSRTRWVVIPSKQKEYLLLRKYAGQGNATTFPVQSIVYSLIAIASLIYKERMALSIDSIKKCAGRIRVFGDDIILPSHATQDLADLLSYLGLKVNVTKSHFSGRFRESCGMDVFNGVDVTPLYMRSLSLKKSPEGIVSWIDVSNNAYRKGLWTLADYMVSMVPKKLLRDIPISSTYQGSLVLATYQAGTEFLGKFRENVSLYRTEMLVLEAKSRTKRRRHGEYKDLLHYFLECKKPYFTHCYEDRASGFLVNNRLMLKRRWVQAC